MESLSHPVARFKYTLTLPIGGTEISAKLANINCLVQQITLKTPALTGAATVRLYLYDELGAELFDSGAATANDVHSFNPTSVRLAGISTLTLTVTAAQAATATFYVLIYGT